MRLILSIALFLITAPVAYAQNLGIQFNKMPVGTKMYYKDYEGDRWVSTFKGRSGNNYVVSVKYNKRSYSAKRYYTLDGHLTKIRFSNGYTIKYSPHNCEQVLGACEYRYDGRRKRNGRYNANLRKSGIVYKYSWARVNTDETYDSTMTFGRYNVLKEETWKTGRGKERYIRLLKIE